MLFCNTLLSAWDTRLVKYKDILVNMCLFLGLPAKIVKNNINSFVKQGEEADSSMKNTVGPDGADHNGPRRSPAWVQCNELTCCRHWCQWEQVVKSHQNFQLLLSTAPSKPTAANQTLSKAVPEQIRGQTMTLKGTSQIFQIHFYRASKNQECSLSETSHVFHNDLCNIHTNQQLNHWSQHLWVLGLEGKEKKVSRT